MRIRKSAFDLDASESTRLKAAYAALRRLYEQSPNDARGWLHQGLVHCWYCSGAGDGLNGQEIHGGWWFLPWHRAFLYFHERILAILLGDPAFALPYWDWDTPGRNRVPDVYRTPSDTSNPLFDPTRKAGSNDRIPDFLVGPKEIQSVLGQMTFALFGGAGEGASGQMGAITPLYAAPELFMGTLSRHCDQYSLAIVFQELLLGPDGIRWVYMAGTAFSPGVPKAIDICMVSEEDGV